METIKVALFIVCLFPGLAVAADLPEKLLDEGKFAEALSAYQAGDQSDPTVLLGEGLALYRLEKFAEAGEKFSKSAELASSPQQKGKALYNFGNSQAQLEKYKEAVKTYETAQKAIPHDRELKENLEFVRKLIKEQNNSGGSKSDKKDDKKGQGKDQSKDQGGQGDSQQKSGDGGGKPDQGQKDQGQSGESKGDSKSEKPDGKQDGQQKSENQQQGQQGKDQQQGKENQQQQGDQGKDGKEGQPKDDQGKDSQSSGTGDQKSDQGKSGDEKQGEGSGSGEQGDQKAQPKPGEGQEKASAADERAETLMNAVESDRGPLMKYRQKKALEELKERNEQVPDKDW